MIVSIAQPAYLPWLGYLARIAVSDAHVVLDHVQLGGGSFTNRNRIRTASGWSWLTVPLRSGRSADRLPITTVEIADHEPWRRKHWHLVANNYARAPYFDAHRPFLEETFRRPWTRLVDLCDWTTRYLLDALDIRTRLVRSSELGITGTKTELNLNLSRALGATTCLVGPLARNYLDERPFAEAGIGVAYHDFAHPTYPQLHGGFEPFMSAIDLLLNRGPESRDILLPPAGHEAYACTGSRGAS